MEFDSNKTLNPCQDCNYFSIKNPSNNKILLEIQPNDLIENKRVNGFIPEKYWCPYNGVSIICRNKVYKAGYSIIVSINKNFEKCVIKLINFTTNEEPFWNIEELK